MDPHLQPQHAKLIAGSAISLETARARGYRSVTDAAALSALGFADYQCRVPALLIPIHDATGTLALHQLRPDNPRSSDGKVIKYETPAGARMCIDVPPSVRHKLGDPRVPLHITEGARKADAAVSKGLCCISILGVWNWRGQNEAGGKVALPDWENIALNKRRKVYLDFDSDAMEKREVHTALGRLAAFLRSRRAQVWFVYLPHGDGGEKVGLDDFLAAGHSVDDLLALASRDLRDLPIEQSDSRQRGPRPRWPEPLALQAFHGFAGDLVRMIEPHSEADPAAILVQTLVAFGNVCGRSAQFKVEATRHYLNLFTVLVGSTSKGRKGTSWDHVRQRMMGVDEAWASRVQQGLSSGEGVIWAVRDPTFKKASQRDDDGEVGEHQNLMTDPGVEDKRLLVVESEFASVLKMAKREGNTLSIIIRQAWDSGELRTLVKNSPAQAKGAHISIIGHITKDELRRNLESTEMANGFANRFLWMCARRSKCLPEGGALRDEDFLFLQRRLAAAVEFARGMGEMRRDDEAREVWKAVYPELSEGQPGLLGAATSRAEAQVMRVSCLYALLDCSAAVRRVHLEAALALWEYSEASARFIFGEALGDPVADEILQALRANPPGLTRTELRDLFKRNRKAHEIDRALALLEEHGLASVVIDHTGGRPAERWVASRHLKGTTTTPVPEGRR